MALEPLLLSYRFGMCVYGDMHSCRLIYDLVLWSCCDCEGRVTTYSYRTVFRHRSYKSGRNKQRSMRIVELKPRFISQRHMMRGVVDWIYYQIGLFAKHCFTVERLYFLHMNLGLRQILYPFASTKRVIDEIQWLFRFC